MILTRTVRRFLDRFSVLWQVRLALGAGLVLNNLLGAAVLLVVSPLIVPVPPLADEAAVHARNFQLALVALVVGTAITMVASRGLMARLALLLEPGRIPTDADRLAVLRAPALLSLVNAVLWSTGAALFGLVGARTSAEYGILLGVTVGLSGLSVTASGFLVAERALRPIARRALSAGVPERLVVPSVTARTVGFWALGSGVVMLGTLIAGAAALRVGGVSATRLAVTMMLLGGVGVVAGGWVSWLSGQASSDPVRSLRQALARVSAGDLSAHVDIYDGTEIGILQAGFNEMVEGLRERENIRELFGKHVGTDVAREALEGGVNFGGEVREVAVLFVDIVGSTTLAAERPPEEVVALLNRFFDVVIDVVHEFRGWINKFEGDAALAIWGAPVAVAAQQSLALAAARVMGERLAEEVPELQAGIGVSAGPAVAGNVGTAERYEYTVIGDPVNEAARLTELAKAVPGHVVANAALVDQAYVEGERWERLDPVVVRGRTDPTPIATPRQDPRGATGPKDDPTG